MQPASGFSVVSNDRISAAVVLALAVGLAACAGSGGRTTDPAHGRQLSDLLCSKCHRIAPDQPKDAGPKLVVAPAFVSIAKEPGVDAPSLSRFTLHLPMGIYQLTTEDREDIVAYILSLRP